MDGLDWSLDVQLPPGGPPSHLDAYKSLYSLGDAGNDLALHLHPNGLCVVTLAPSHAALQPGGGGGAPPAASTAQDRAAAARQLAGNGSAAAQQTAPEAAAGRGEAAAAAGAAGAEQQAAAQQAVAARVALSPKLLQAEYRKGRGPLLQPETVLGRLTVGAAEWVLRCGVRGLLVDVNQRLDGMQGDALLRELGCSYLAILDVRPAEAAQLADRCLAAQQYRERAAGKQQQERQAEQASEQQPA